MKYIRKFEQLTRKDVPLAGGKGANLGELVRARFPVPPGLVLTTFAYDRFVTSNRLDEIILQTLHNEDTNGVAIRNAFRRAPIPKDIEREILRAYQELGEGPVAVRSSATAEDLPGATFAGQQDTFLNVIGREMLLNAIKDSWASLWTDRAIAYRMRQAVDQQAVKLAVVVQRMVMPEFAGVMFTANPVTGNRSEVVIDANPGLGEAVVSGLVTPDHFVLYKGWLGWKITERREGNREVVIRARSGGGTERIEERTHMGTINLPDNAIIRLAKLGVQVQRHFATPQDIEWVYRKGELFLVQARPMTALTEPLQRGGKLYQTLAALFAEMLAVKPYPFDQSAWMCALSEAITSLFEPLGIQAPPFEQMFIEEDGVVVRFGDRLSFRPTPAILLAPLRIGWILIRYNPLDYPNDWLLKEAKAQVSALKEESQNLEDLSYGEMLAIVHKGLALLKPLAGKPRQRYWPRSLLAMGIVRLMLSLARQENAFGTLVFTGVRNLTSESNRELEKLAMSIRKDPTLVRIFATRETAELLAILARDPSGRLFLSEFRDFLRRYGHRETTIVGPSQPTWSDVPEVVLGMLKGLVPEEQHHDSIDHSWMTARDEILRHSLLRFPPLRLAFLKSLLEARCFLQIRENTHFDATLVLPILRKTVLEIGKRLMSVHILAAPEDAFHLKIEELDNLALSWPPSSERVIELQALVERRKKLRAELSNKPVIDPRIFQKVIKNNNALLQGVPGSPGIAEGIVRVIREPAEFQKLRTGEVLVAPYTNPSWTPLFQRAVAVVVDSGGTGSHAAIIAREYHIPAVMGTVEGTRKLSDGEWIRVDGTQGLVFWSSSAK